MKSTCGCEGKCSNPNFGLFLLRAVTGAIFIYSGLLKFQHLAEVKVFFTAFHLAPWLVPVVAFFEVIGGLSLVLGMWTCIFAPILSVIILGAIICVKWKMGWVGIQFETLILASTLAIKSLGCGDWKVGSGCGCKMCKKDLKQ